MKRLAAAALLLAVSAPFWSIAHPLWEVDDARYAEVPREMAASGRWLVPTLDGMPYVEKPPLIYWMGAASLRVLGVSEAAARLPLALTAAAGLAGVWWLGAWLFAPAVGAAAVLVLGTSLLSAGLAHVITPDMAVSVALLWATGLILRVLRRPEDAGWAAPAAWLAMAAAFLAKGLIGFVLPAAWTGGLAVLFPELRPGLRRLLWGPGPLLFAAVVAPWVWGMEKAEPGFCRFFFGEQHFQRFTSVAKYNRGEPWWFFLATDVGGTLPWTPAALAASLLPLMRGRRGAPAELQLALWPLLVIAFFSSSSSKLVTYLLPALPHQAVLAARLLQEPAGRGRRAAGAALAALLAAGGVAAFFLVPARLPEAAPAALPALGALLALAASCALAGWSPAALPAAALAGLAAVAFALAGAAQLEPLLSARPLSAALSRRAAAAEAETPGVPVRLVAYDRYLHGVPFYTGRLVDVVDWVGELHYAKRFPRFAGRFGDDDQIVAWPRTGERVLVYAPKPRLAWLAQVRGGMQTLRGVEEAGPYVLAELRPAATAPAAPPSSAGGRGRAP